MKERANEQTKVRKKRMKEILWVYSRGRIIDTGLWLHVCKERDATLEKMLFTLTFLLLSRYYYHYNNNNCYYYIK
jgi:hypothetical protein